MCQYISAAKYMIILKPLQLGVPNFHTEGTQGHTLRESGRNGQKWRTVWDEEMKTQGRARFCYIWETTDRAKAILQAA